MNRREVIGMGGATLAGALFAPSTFVQSAAAAQTAPAAAAAPAKLRLDCYSRTMHWLRTPAEVAQACHEVGYTSVDLTVRSGGGHVDPAKVTTDLPAFTKGLRDNGIDVSMIAPTITNADDKYAEETLAAAASVGIKYYWWGTYRYDETKPYWPQLDALKPKVEALAKLNEKYGMKAMAHPRDGSGSVSAAFYDLLYVLKDFDPRWVSFQYDTHHLLQAYDGGWVQQLRLGAPYIGGFVWKDVMIEPVDSPNPDDEWRKAHPRTPAAGAGGPGGGTPVAGGPGGAGGAGGPGAGGVAGAGGPGGAAGGGGGRGGGGRGAGGAGGAAVAGAAGAPGGPGGGGGGGRGGAARPANTAPTHTRIRQVPVGTGEINLALIAQTLKEIGFNGPMECEPEWPQLGGADQGATTLSIPREEAIALMKRDYTTMTGIMTTAGLM